MKSNYKTILFGLIQLIIIACLIPLAHSEVEQDTSNQEPQLCCELGVFNQALKLILCNTSAAAKAPDNYQLVLEEKNERVENEEVPGVRFQTTAGKVVTLTPGKSIPLSTLLDSKTLPTDDKTFIFTLVPGKSSYAKLVLSIKDAEGNVVGESVSVVYRVTKSDRMLHDIMVSPLTYIGAFIGSIVLSAVLCGVANRRRKK